MRNTELAILFSLCFLLDLSLSDVALQQEGIREIIKAIKLFMSILIIYNFFIFKMNNCNTHKFNFQYFTDRPSNRLAPYNRLGKTDYLQNYYATRLYTQPYFKDTKKDGFDIYGNPIKLIRKETYNELNDLIIDPKHFFEETELSDRVELTPSRMGADPGNAISYYLNDGARNFSDYHVQTSSGRSRDKAFLKNLKKRTAWYSPCENIEEERKDSFLKYHNGKLVRVYNSEQCYPDQYTYCNGPVARYSEGLDGYRSCGRRKDYGQLTKIERLLMED